MRSFITLAVVAALACTAAPALAVPADSGTPPTQTPANVERVAPAAPTSDGGTATGVYALIAAGGFLALGGGGFLGARSITARQVRPHAS
jgi:hypothetical protein